MSSYLIMENHGLTMGYTKQEIPHNAFYCVQSNYPALVNFLALKKTKELEKCSLHDILKIMEIAKTEINSMNLDHNWFLSTLHNDEIDYLRGKLGMESLIDLIRVDQFKLLKNLKGRFLKEIGARNNIFSDHKEEIIIALLKKYEKKEEPYILEVIYYALFFVFVFAVCTAGAQW